MFLILLAHWSVLTCYLRLLRLAGVTALCASLWQSLWCLVFPQLKGHVTYKPPFKFKSLNTCLQIPAGAVSTC